MRTKELDEAMPLVTLPLHVIMLTRGLLNAGKNSFFSYGRHIQITKRLFMFKYCFVLNFFQ